MKVTKSLFYGLLLIALLLSQTLFAIAEDEGDSTATQQTVIGAFSKAASKASSDKKSDVTPADAKKVISILEDRNKRTELIDTLKTIVSAQDKIDKKDEKGVIASTRTLLGGVAERSLIGVQAIVLSFWNLIGQGVSQLKKYTPTDVALTLTMVLFSLMVALGVESLVRRLSLDGRMEQEEVKNWMGQVRFVLTQTIHFIAFCTPLYLVNAIGMNVGEHIKPFGLELASIGIIIRAAFKLRALHLLVKKREISTAADIILVFFMVLFFVLLYVIHHSYLLHVGIYLFVLAGFFMALRSSSGRTHKREFDDWVFLKLSHTSFGHELYNFNDKLLKFFSGYMLVLMAFLFLQIISGSYANAISEYQMFRTCFVLLLTSLLIIMAVYVKFGLLKLVERYAHAEMVKFYQQTLLSTMDIATFLLVVFFGKTLTEIWFENFIDMVFHPEYQDYFRSLSKIVFYGILSRFLWRLIDFLAVMNVSKKKVGHKMILPSQLRLTVTPILKSVGHWLLIIFTLALILEEVGIPIWPIIYSISVLGIAISLGAQSLVKDFINGILTLVEGNIAIGEVVTIGSFTGMVETLSLRGVVLRHSTGALQTIPFSEVTNIINRSRDYCSASVEIPVPFETKIQDVYQAFQKAFEDIQSHEIYGHKIIDRISIKGVDRMADGAYYVTASVKIKPDPGGGFVKVYNEYLQRHLTEMGITPPPMHGG